MCSSLELSLHCKLIIPLINCLIFYLSIFVKNEFLVVLGLLKTKKKKKLSYKNACWTNNLEPDPEPELNVKSELDPDLKKIIMELQHCFKLSTVPTSGVYILIRKWYLSPPLPRMIFFPISWHIILQLLLCPFCLNSSQFCIYPLYFTLLLPSFSFSFPHSSLFFPPFFLFYYSFPLFPCFIFPSPQGIFQYIYTRPAYRTYLMFQSAYLKLCLRNRDSGHGT
jgi:hypothetical protein